MAHSHDIDTRYAGADVGVRAGEMLGEMALAMQHNLTLNDILATIHAYPTMNTGIQQSAFEAYLEGTLGSALLEAAEEQMDPPAIADPAEDGAPARWR